MVVGEQQHNRDVTLCELTDDDVSKILIALGAIHAISEKSAEMATIQKLVEQFILTAA